MRKVLFAALIVLGAGCAACKKSETTKSEPTPATSATPVEAPSPPVGGAPGGVMPTVTAPAPAAEPTPTPAAAPPAPPEAEKMEEGKMGKKDSPAPAAPKRAAPKGAPPDDVMANPCGN